MVLDFTDMCSDSEAGSHLRLIDFVYRSTLGLRVIKKRREDLVVVGVAGRDDVVLLIERIWLGTYKTVKARNSAQVRQSRPETRHI